MPIPGICGRGDMDVGVDMGGAIGIDMGKGMGIDIGMEPGVPIMPGRLDPGVDIMGEAFDSAGEGEP